MSLSPFIHAHDLANKVVNQGVLVCDVVEFFLNRIEKKNSSLNAFTLVCAERARSRAKYLDGEIARGRSPGPLAGVPFAVKNLFDIQGEITLAGSLINRSNQAAKNDALLIQRLEAAGAILIGGLAMGEFAYDFTGENAHYGNCANPWALDHMSGGSSSGSGSAAAAGLVPLTLGSDTNGSIRVPASFCGIFGLKPTFGRLPRTGTYPFSDSLDHLGPMAKTVFDIALSFDAMQGHDEEDSACVNRPVLKTCSTLNGAIDSLKISRAGGYFSTNEFPQATKAVEKICRALSVDASEDKTVVVPGALEGRSAAYLITNIEGSAHHLKHIQSRATDFDPDTRDRFIAGALLPGSWYIRAQQVRNWYFKQVLNMFEDVDILIAPATPFTAPQMGQKYFSIAGEKQLLRPNLGYFTQPISAIGLPSIVVPTLDDESNMPIGVQIIAAPWREDLCLQVAYFLEQNGFASLNPNTDYS